MAEARGRGPLQSKAARKIKNIITGLILRRPGRFFCSTGQFGEALEK
jgi:hypothetical protein